MSIRAIDSQMMITRAADLTRDASSEAQKAQLSSQYQAAQAKALEEKERTSVLQPESAEKAEIHADKDGAKGDDPRGARGKKASSSPKEAPAELAVGSGTEHMIDITV